MYSNTYEKKSHRSVFPEVLYLGSPQAKPAIRLALVPIITSPPLPPAPYHTDSVKNPTTLFINGYQLQLFLFTSGWKRAL